MSTVAGARRAIRLVVLVAAVIGVTSQPVRAQTLTPLQPPGSQPGQVPPPATPALSPTLTEANQAISSAHAAAARAGIAVSCAVVDSRGDPVSVARMDGARFFTTDVARGKAVSSALFGQPSASLGKLSPAIVSAVTGTGARLVLVQGAVPVVRNGQGFGAIGCSGGTGQQDEDAAKAGQQILQAGK